MAEAIRIEIENPADAADLARAFAVRGLVGEVVPVNGRCEVEIVSRREQTERLLIEVLAALEAWCADRDRISACVRVGERSYAFEASSGSLEPAHARAA